MTLSRRRLLQYAASASALAATGTIPGSIARAFAAEEGKRVIPWKNWSGGQSCTPSMRVAPSDEAELAKVIVESAAPIRAVGAGHSFSGLEHGGGVLRVPLPSS